MTSEKEAPKFYTDDDHFPDVGSAPTNRKHYPNLSSDASSVWNLCTRFSNVISRGNQWWRRKMSTVFLRLFKLPQMRHSLVIIIHVEVACKLPFHSVIARVFKNYCIFLQINTLPCSMRPLKQILLMASVTREL